MPVAPETANAASAYRVLILQPDGAVADVQRLLVADDDEAIALAKSMVAGKAVELWEGLRFIEHYASVNEHHGDSS